MSFAIIATVLAASSFSLFVLDGSVRMRWACLMESWSPFSSAYFTSGIGVDLASLRMRCMSL